MRNGSVCRKPPMNVMKPVTSPRKTGLPRPVSEPSSESPSENAIEIPAPTADAAPIRKTVRELCVANAVAKMGARVETEPSINPARPGCTMRRTKLLSSPTILLNSLRLGMFSDIGRWRWFLLTGLLSETHLLRSAAGWRVRAESVSSQLLAAASWAGAAAAGTAVAVRATTGSTTASAGEAATAVAAAEAVLVAAIVGVRRRHRCDGIVTLPGTSLELHNVHPRSCYVEGLVAN